MAIYCMDCGEQLITVNYTNTCTKYKCEKCKSYWFRSTITTVEWKKRKVTDQRKGE